MNMLTLITFAPLVGKLPDLKHVIVSGGDAQGQMSFSALLDKAATTFTLCISRSIQVSDAHATLFPQIQRMA